MSIVQKTKEYAIEVSEAALNAFDKQARGDLQAPNGAENVRLFTAKGGSAVTLANGTRSAAVVYDPECSLRNGQLSVEVFERDSTDAVTKVQTVNLGRPTTEFLSVGLMSSGLKVFNSSGVDVIGGTQTAAVLTSVPRDVSTLTSTDVANFCSNHERDMASGIISREDATMTMNLTDHYGKKMCLARTNTVSNVVKRTWDDGVGSRRTTIGQSLGPTGTTAMDSVPLNSSARDDAAILAATTQHFIDTSRITGANNPMTLATYNADFEFMSSFANANSADTDYRMIFRAIALDAAGTVLDSILLLDIANIPATAGFVLRGRGTVTSSTVPIARIVVGIQSTDISLSNLDFLADQSTAKVSAYEESADIPARGIHVCVLEGLNASATLNINSFAVLTGVPDSANIFIANNTGTDDVYDFNAVDIFLQSISRTLPRAFTVAGHGAFAKELTAMYASEPVSIAFQAMSFGDVAKGVKKASAMAKVASKDVQDALRMLGPLLSDVGDVASMLPGPVGTAGRMMSQGGRLARMASDR